MAKKQVNTEGKSFCVVDGELTTVVEAVDAHVDDDVTLRLVSADGATVALFRTWDRAILIQDEP